MTYVMDSNMKQKRIAGPGPPNGHTRVHAHKHSFEHPTLSPCPPPTSAQDRHAPCDGSPIPRRVRPDAVPDGPVRPAGRTGPGPGAVRPAGRPVRPDAPWSGPRAQQSPISRLLATVSIGCRAEEEADRVVLPGHVPAAEDSESAMSVRGRWGLLRPPGRVL